YRLDLSPVICRCRYDQDQNCHTFPTRRSADLEFHSNGKVDISVFGATVRGDYKVEKDRVLITGPQGTIVFVRKADALEGPMGLQDRKSTRLNSSHVKISYAVFCLKTKKNEMED